MATSIARRMVREFGMSPLGNILIDDDNIGPDLATRADSEVSCLVVQAYETAKEILTTNREKLVSISEYLMQVETIDAQELDLLLFGPGGYHIAEVADPVSEVVTLAEVSA